MSVIGIVVGGAVVYCVAKKTGAVRVVKKYIRVKPKINKIKVKGGYR